MTEAPAAPDSLDDQWFMLERHLLFSHEPWVGFILVRASSALVWIRRKIGIFLREQGRFVSPLEAETPAETSTLLDRIQAQTRVDLVWVQSLWRDPPDDELLGPQDAAREQFMLRANERREALLRKAHGGLLFVLPLDQKPRIRDLAPDLWSIRSIVLELTDRTAWKRQPETFRLPVLAPVGLPEQRHRVLRLATQIGKFTEISLPGELPHTVDIDFGQSQWLLPSSDIQPHSRSSSTRRLLWQNHLNSQWEKLDAMCLNEAETTEMAAPTDFMRRETNIILRERLVAFQEISINQYRSMVDEFYTQSSVTFRKFVVAEVNLESCLAAISLMRMMHRVAPDTLIKALTWAARYTETMRQVSYPTQIVSWYEARLESSAFSLKKTGQRDVALPGGGTGKLRALLQTTQSSSRAEDLLSQRYIAQLREALAIAQTHQMSEMVRDIEAFMLSLGIA